jgi:hypothetical protein
VVTDGIISVAATKEYEDRQEFFVKNGDGIFCVRETNAPILKWINLVLTFCNVDPELVNLMTANSTVADDSAAAKKTGYNEDENAATSAYFAFEGWTRLTNQGISCTGGTEYGYVLYPRVVEGTIGDITYQNDVVSFIVTPEPPAVPCGVRVPYYVDLSDNCRHAGYPDPSADTDPVDAASANVHHQGCATDRCLRLYVAIHRSVAVI